MLTLKIDGGELWDEQSNQFVYVKGKEIVMEHSLLALSKWEAKYEKALLDRNVKVTEDELLDYYRFMTVTPNVDPNLYLCLTLEHKRQIKEYMEAKHTATIVKHKPNQPVNNGKFISSELIYYWMIEMGVPFDCEKWNLNRLMTLIDVVATEQGPKQKMSQKDTAALYSAQNKARLAKMRAKG